MSKDTLTDMHDRGQKDAAEGNGHNAPHGVMDKMLTAGANNDRVWDENAAYDQGYQHAKSQQK